VATTRALDPGLTERIRATTLELLAERGFRDLRLDDVAARVGTSKQALYRRFTSKSEIVADAVRSLGVTGYANPPRTGSLRRDLIAALGGAVRNLERTALGAALRALVAEEHDDVLARVLTDIDDSRRRVIRAVLDAARDRAEIARDRDLDLDVDILLGAAYVRTIVRRVPLDRTLAESVVDVWLNGATGRGHG
jgi:AcrR family transcriptional regulator